VLERNSLALTVDGATAVFGRVLRLSVQYQYTIKTPIEGSGHRSKCSRVVRYTSDSKFLLLETVESGNHLAWGASCYLVFIEEAEKVIHTVQATGVGLSNGSHDRALPHPQDIAV